MKADARRLPFRDSSFDTIVTAPPWDNPRVVHQALAEMARVVRPGGRMVLMLRHRTELRDDRGRVVRRLPPLPQTGERTASGYRGTPPEGVAALLSPGERVLDPFCGDGGVVKGAAMVGAHGFGCDIA